MNESKTRDKILKRIRQALLDKAPDPYPHISFSSALHEYDEQEFPELLFAENFIAAGGHFTFCENESELKAFLQQALKQLNASNIICTHPVLKNFVKEIIHTEEANTSASGVSISHSFCLTTYPPSLVMSSSSFFHHADHHIVVAFAQDTVHELKQGLQRIKEAVRNNSDNNFQIISFAETGNEEKSIAYPAKNFFIAMIDRKL